MAITPYSCSHAKLFWKAEDWRLEAEKHEKLARLSDEDGDTFFAKQARKDAALCRQRAREIEVEQPQ